MVWIKAVAGITLAFSLCLFTPQKTSAGSTLAVATGTRLPSDLESPQLDQRVTIQRTQERYRDIRRDAERLLELSAELKQQVDRASQGELSVDAIKKTVEIEKLAKQLRSKLQNP